MPSQILQTSIMLYSEMDELDRAAAIASAGWNDRVSEAIKVNKVNKIIERCNYVNQDLQTLGQQISTRIERMESLLASISNA